MTDIDPSLLEAIASLIEGAGGDPGDDDTDPSEPIVHNIEETDPSLFDRLKKIEEQINQ